MPQAAQILASAIWSAPHFGQVVSVLGSSGGAESDKLIAPVPEHQELITGSEDLLVSTHFLKNKIVLHRIYLYLLEFSRHGFVNSGRLSHGTSLTGFEG